MFIVWLLDLKQHKLDVQTEINTLARLRMIEFERGLKVKTPKEGNLWAFRYLEEWLGKERRLLRTQRNSLFRLQWVRARIVVALDQRVALFKHLMMLSVFDTFKNQTTRTKWC